KAGEFVQSEAFRAGLGKYTAHAKARYYPTIFDAVVGNDGTPDGTAGKIPLTTDAFDLYSILNEEMARANTNAKLREALISTGLGKEVAANQIPPGYKALEGMDRDIPIATHETLGARRGRFRWSQRNEEGAMLLRKRFVVPEKIANGLAALSDPNFTKRLSLI